MESKDYLLNELNSFKEIEKMLSIYMEGLEKELSKENREKFDKIVKLMYQVEEYYIALAYMLGNKHGKDIL